jgi:predicted metal-dependent hydrolase
LAKKILPMRVEQLANRFWYNYKSIKINSAKTRWGSCTSQKNLNFTFRLVLTPPEIIDYVICHELAHLKEMNHSKAFRNEVEKMDKNYKKHDRWLKDNWDLYVF